jgi:hypothetical protein
MRTRSKKRSQALNGIIKDVKTPKPVCAFDAQPFWLRWRDMTRLFVGIDHSADLWVKAHKNSVGDDDASVVKINWRGVSNFEAPVREMISLLSEKSMMGQMMFVNAYTLAEGFVGDVFENLGKDRGLVSSGIEAWSENLLQTLGVDWSRIRGGKKGLLEAAILRNAIVHGYSRYPESDEVRYNNIGIKPAWCVGDPIPMSLNDALAMRYHLQCFLRVLTQSLAPKR